MDEDKTTTFPTAQDFCLEVPLYASYKFSSPAEVLRVEFYFGTLDTFCVNCNRESVFQSAVEHPYILSGSLHPAYNVEQILECKGINLDRSNSLFLLDGAPPSGVLPIDYYNNCNRIFGLPFNCTRDPSHRLLYIFRVQESQLIKIGQFPSLADLENTDLNKYRGVLNDEKLRELKRAIGLISHGVGIGAFVYLRRIFENLIEEARESASKEPAWNNENFKKARVEEKILLLKSYLPDFLVENRSLYVILSKGIHELTEEECLKYFDVVKVAIELILDEKLEKKDREDKIRKVSGAISTVKGEISKK